MLRKLRERIQSEESGFTLIEPVEPRTPALFDALAGRHGSYDVDFAPVVGRTVRLGRVVVSGSSRRP